MLTIRCLRSYDADYGHGIYTLEPILAGQVVWRYTPTVDRILPLATLAAMTREMRERVDLLRDAAQAAGPSVEGGLLLQHSSAPNLDFSEPGIGFALRDIAAGEALTADRAQFSLPETADGGA